MEINHNFFCIYFFQPLLLEIHEIQGDISMKTQLKIHSHTNLGAAMGIDVIGHPNVQYFTVSMDYGHGYPDWPRMQTVPDCVFTLDPKTSEHVYPLLGDNGVKIINHKHNPGHSCVAVEPEDVAKTMRLLEFEEDAVAQVVRMQEDAASRRAMYMKNLTSSNVQTLKDLDRERSDRVLQYVQTAGTIFQRNLTMTPCQGGVVQALKDAFTESDIVCPVPARTGADAMMRGIGAPRPAFTL
jgi:hypothetical protein